MIELEALVTHLYLVGGRMVGAPPPGFLAMPAPKKAARPRQNETLFMLVIPTGVVKADATVYQNLVQQGADFYFKTTGGITGGLREMLTMLNTHILAEQQRLMQSLRVSILIGVQRDQEIYVGRCGQLFAIYKHESTLASFPSKRTDDAFSMTPPLGAVMEPHIELNRYDLHPNDYLVFLDTQYQNVDDAAFKTALTQPDIADTLPAIKALLPEKRPPLAHTTIIQFVTEDTPTPEAPALKQPSVVLTPSVTPPQSAPSVATPLTAQVPSTQTLPESSPAADITSKTPSDVTEQPETPKDIPLQEQPEIEQITTDSEAATPRLGIRKGLARVLTGVAQGTNQIGNSVFSERDAEADNQSAIWSNLIVLLGVLIPMVVLVVVVGLILNGNNESEFELCRAEVLSLVDAARQLTPAEGSVDQERIAQSRQQWIITREEAFACELEKPGDEEMLTIAGEAQNNLDRFDRVTRRDIAALREFDGENLDMQGPISGNWIDIYSLDRTNDAVYRDTLSTNGQTLIDVGTQPIIFQGQSVSGNVVGELVDIEWLERGGLPGGISNLLITLDETGLLIWYSETFGEEAISLITPDTWSTPTAMAMWRLNLYILDSQAQQVWRYVPNQGLYSELPEEYFSGETRPNLLNAIDMGIDEDGSVYIQFSDGTLKKYRGGVEQPFDIFNLPMGALTQASSLFVDNNPISRSLVVTDPSNQTLYTLSLGGTVNQGYRPLNDLSGFENLAGALMNADSGSIYVLADSKLYWMAR